MDITSHESLLDPFQVEDELHVVGCGAIGSHIALYLTKLGFTKLSLYDFDNVEPHNIANQAYAQKHIGMSKVEALKDVLEYHTGLVLTPDRVLNGRIGASQRFDGVVFMCVDSMAGRQEIYKNGVRLKAGVPLMIDVRMNPWDSRVYTIDPGDMDDCAFWEENSQYTDDDSNVPASACGRTVSVGPTAVNTATIAVLQFMRWCRRSRMGLDTDGRIKREVFSDLFGMEVTSL